jgi:hypothetical protein
MNLEPGLLLDRILAAKLSLDPEDIESIRNDLSLLQVETEQSDANHHQELAKATLLLEKKTKQVEDALIKSRLLSHLLTTLIDSSQ